MICGRCGIEHTGIITSDGICGDCRSGKRMKEIPVVTPEPKAKAKPKPKKAKVKVETVSKEKETSPEE